jgi:hypothetical protein
MLAVNCIVQLVGSIQMNYGKCIISSLNFKNVGPGSALVNKSAR